MIDRPTRSLGLIALALACGSGLLAIATANPLPQNVIVIATLPPSPTPVPRLPLVREQLFTTNSGEASTNIDAKGTPNYTLQSGVLGVSLAGDASVASVMLGGHIYWVHIGSPLAGHRVTSIALDGITLDNGAHIARGTGSTSEAPAPVVPAIEATPSPLIPTQASDDQTHTTSSRTNFTNGNVFVPHTPHTPTPFMPSSFPTPSRLEPPA